MAAFQHEGITFHYELVGEGPPLVFSHGLAWDLDRSRELLGQIPGCQLITWDTRAHGKTAPVGPAEGLLFRTFAGDLAALLDHLRIDTAIIGGISMGAGVATQFAVDHPERVLGLLLIQPAWLPDRHPTNLDSFAKIADLLDQFGVEEGLGRFEQDPEFQELLKSAPDAAASLVGQFHKPLAAERSIRLKRMPADRPVGDWDRIAQLRAPALVMGSEGDPIHPIEYAERWARRIPQSQFRRVTPKAVDPGLYTQAIRSEVRLFLKTLASPNKPPAR